MEDFTQDIELRNAQGLYDNLEQKSEALEIFDATTQDSGSDLRADALKIIKVIEARRKFFTEPQNIILKQINEFYRNAKVPFETIAGNLKTKLLDYDALLKEEKRKAEEKEKQRLQKLAGKEAEKNRILAEEHAKKEAEKARIAKEQAIEKGQEFVPPEKEEFVPPPPPPPPVPMGYSAQVPKNIKTERSTSSTRDNWKAEIIDENAFKRWAAMNNQFAYLKIDSSALNKYAKIKKDSEIIPGIRFWNDTGLSTRG